MLCTHIIANAGAKVINKAQDARHKIKGAGYKAQGPVLRMLKFVITGGISPCILSSYTRGLLPF
jgi:hypothetical protein